MVASSVADIIKIIMLAASANAFLRCRCARCKGALIAGKNVFKRGADALRVCPFFSKKERKDSRRSFTLVMVYPVMLADFQTALMAKRPAFNRDIKCERGDAKLLTPPLMRIF